jgi:hypothetical protein
VEPVRSPNFEANIKIAGANTIVENMRKGMSSEGAGLDAPRRIAENLNNILKGIEFWRPVFRLISSPDG